MFCTLVSCLSAGMIAIIASISATKPPALRRPAIASRPATNSSIASPIEPISCTIAEEMLRSEEHTSELQSLMRISYAVFCLKKKKKKTNKRDNTHLSIQHKKQDTEK